VISGSAPVHAIIHLHAIRFASWLVLFVAQTLLVALRRRVDDAVRLDPRTGARAAVARHPAPP
jgi:hypothetical protein